MRKTPYILLLCFLLGLTVMGATAAGVSLLFSSVPQLAESHWMVQLIPAVLLMVGAIVAHNLSREKSWAYILGYLLNAAGSGWAIGVLMSVKAIMPGTELIWALAPAALLGTLCCLLMGPPDSKRSSVVTGVFLVLAVLLLIGGIVMWICLPPLTGCVFVFSALFALPFPVGVNTAQDNPADRFRYLSFTGFGAFILILAVVLFILSEGEALDGLDCDCGDCGSGRRSKAKRR